MRTFLRPSGLSCLVSLMALVAVSPVVAQEASDKGNQGETPPALQSEPSSGFTVNGSAIVVSDYRFRGISQTDKNFVVHGSLTVSHQSGLYVSVWGSSVDDYVTASLQSNQEIDLIVGFKKTVGSATIDIGALYYVYPKSKLPGDNSSSDFIEPYFSISGIAGPLSAKATVAYAPKQKALALDQGATGLLPSQDNLYIAGDFSAGISGTPIGLTAHIGHTFGPSWLVPVPKTEYTDWALGATVTYKALTLGLQYVDTDASPFVTASGKNVSKGGVVATLGVSF